MLQKPGNIAEPNGIPQYRCPDASQLPEPSSPEISRAAAIEKQLEGSVMDDWLAAIGKPYAAIVTEVMEHYGELRLSRNPQAGMTGRNTFMEEIRSGNTSPVSGPRLPIN